MRVCVWEDRAEDVSKDRQRGKHAAHTMCSKRGEEGEETWMG